MILKSSVRLPLDIPVFLPNVQIQGPKRAVRIPLVLDTGATITTFFSDTPLFFAGYELNETPIQSVLTGNGVVLAKSIQLESLSISHLKVEKLEVLYYQIPDTSERTKRKFRGVLGLNFLKHFKTTLDFKRNILEFS